VTAARAASRGQEPDHHHLQEAVGGDPHHPQVCQAEVGDQEPHARAVSHHPQTERYRAPTPAGERRVRRDGEGRTFADGERPDDRNALSTQRPCTIEPPPPGALRPLARALLALAAEAHAARSEVHRTVCREHERTLRMAEAGVRHPVRLPLRLGLVSPATPERTGCQDASSHAEAAFPPPVENPDCIGECA
jgi:hypothetical protein